MEASVASTTPASLPRGLGVNCTGCMLTAHSAQAYLQHGHVSHTTAQRGSVSCIQAVEGRVSYVW
jgi:hypothetical protein